MSFVGRVQLDAEYTDEDIHLLVAGTKLANARAAERRSYEWDILSRFLEASPEELFGLSERAWLLGSDRKLPRLAAHAPWSRQVGYGPHCPCCLQESGHWRKAWLKPDALICVRHEAVLVRHCPCCATDLTEHVWSRALPLCPSCGGHLSLGVRVPAPSMILAEAAKWSARFAGIISNGPLLKQDAKVAHWAATWRAVRLMTQSGEPALNAVAETLVELSGLGPLSKGNNAADRALRFSQVSLAAHRIDELQRALTEHYWLVMGMHMSSSSLDIVVRSQLFQLARSLGIGLEAELRCQAVLSSEASESGWNLLPIAA